MEPSVLSQALGFATFAALTLATLTAIAFMRRHYARPETVKQTAPRGGSTTCHGHYYRKAFADMWRCVNCGHLQPVTNRDVAEEAATELRGELGAIEAYANGEAGA